MQTLFACDDDGCAVDIASLRCFIQVHETLSYSKAARSLFMSRQAVTYRIRQLENELGANLFSQQGKQLERTALGSALYDASKGVVSDFEQMESSVRRLAQGAQSGFALSVGFQTTSYLDPSALVSIKLADASASQLVIKDSADDHALHDLDAGVIDMALVIASAHDLVGHEYRLLKKIEQRLLVPKSLAASKLAQLTPADLRDVPFVTYEAAVFGNRLVERECAQLGFEPLLVFNQQDILAATSSARTRGAVTWHGYTHEVMHITDGFEVVPIVFSDQTWGVYAVWSARSAKGSLSSGIAKQLAEYCR